MIIEAGHYALILALTLALFQAILPLVGMKTGHVTLMRLAGSLALAQLVFVTLAFAALTWAYITSDFSVVNVVENSHSAKPLLYKITGVWGNHEGSMLLWVLILVLFGAAVALFGRELPLSLKAGVLGIQAMIAVAFEVFILFSSNPFRRISPPPQEGNDLNPLLQDIGLAIHPPLLYLGYVGCSIAFAFALAALIEGRIDAVWARWVRPWTLAAWIFLTLGIASGSYWAYYELGWGGWWFWDPVENASLMPWLATTALLHSAIVMEKRDALKIWTILLSIMAFSFSLLGTFMVRSGILTSVHAFAVDPERGIFILIILAVFIGGALGLFALRAPVLRMGGVFAPVSREGALVLNNLFLMSACSAVLLGTLYPLLLEALTGDKISVGPPYFNLVFASLILPLLVFLPLGPFLGWKRGDMTAGLRRLWPAAVVACVIMLGVMIKDQPLSAVMAGVAAFVLMGCISELVWRTGVLRLPAAEGWSRLRGLPSAHWGMFLAHAGVGITLLGVLGETMWKSEALVQLKAGQGVELAGYALTFEGGESFEGPNYREQRVRLTVRRAGVVVDRLLPSRRTYPARNMPTTEAALMTRGVSQLYVSPGEIHQDGSVDLRVWYKPLVLLIWGGAGLMAVGGVLSLLDRRLRLGIAQRRRKLTAQGVAVMLALGLVCAGPMSAYAIQPDEVMTSPQQEARARALGSQLRCMVCQNESIEESHSDLARDLRLLVREQIREGRSDQDILDFLSRRYGEFILLKPHFGIKTLVLWCLPFLLLGGGALYLLRSARRQAKTVDMPVDAEEKHRIDQLLQQK